MTEIIVFPDALELALDFLAPLRVAAGDSETHFGGKVSTEARQVVGTLVDTELHNLVVQWATLRFDCYVDETFGRQEAQDLGQWCRAALGAMQGAQQSGTTVYRVRDGAPGLSDAPDEITGKVRYSFHVVISLRGTGVSISV